MMHAWINDETVVVTILPSEAEPEMMGPIYKISYHDMETMEELAQMRKMVTRAEQDFHRRLAAKLRKEQEPKKEWWFPLA